MSQRLMEKGKSGAAYKGAQGGGLVAIVNKVNRHP